MEALIRYKDRTQHNSQNKEIRHIIIQVEGNEFLINFNPVYGLIINKVNIDDKGTDLISVMPRTGNEIIIK